MAGDEIVVEAQGGLTIANLVVAMNNMTAQLTAKIDRVEIRMQALEQGEHHWFRGQRVLVLVKFKIGAYQDEVKCDVVPMQACHLLLGRPWQYDRVAIHDGRANTYAIQSEGKSLILKPWSPKQVIEDYHRMKELKKAAKGKASIVTDPKSTSPPLGNEKVCAIMQPGEYFKGNDENKMMICLVHKGILLSDSDDLSNANQFSSFVANLWHDFVDLFPEEMPSGLPPLRGIEHQIDLSLDPKVRTNQPIGVIRKTPRNSKGRLMSF
ncbi:uncharacterized protein LOC132045176 [Lycium ferocissimum]|uniref:uncharacterized protein LOC132045176 n=1 Tax=Lycium ferocissimum TaxID=112874 RepID=UPI0028159DEA|nr:uncharacterized protein LOC132045176 [Lycium ferocissimum]